MNDIKYANDLLVVWVVAILMTAALFSSEFRIMSKVSAGGTSGIGKSSVPVGISPKDWDGILAANYASRTTLIGQQAYLKPAAIGLSQSNDYFGYSVAVSGDTIVVGASGEDSSTIGVNTTPNENSGSSGAVYIFTRSAGVWVQEAYLKPAAVGTSQANDVFGASVAISGDTVVVGAPFEDSSTTGINSTPNENSMDSGAAYIFTRNAGVWTQRAYLKPVDIGSTQAGDQFGNSVAISGDTVVVGASGENSSSLGVNGTPNEISNDAGAAYVFVRNSGTWTQQAYLKPAEVGTSQANDLFGWSVGISGETIVVGAFNEDGSSTGVNSTPNENSLNSGAAYIFARNSAIWTQVAYLKPLAVGTSQVNDSFGWSVGISGDTVVVGAYLEDSGTTGVNSTPNEGAFDSGAVYVFIRSSGIWSQQAYLKPVVVGITQVEDQFGNSVAVSGDTIVVGANGEDSSTFGINSTPNESSGGSGAGYVFSRRSGVWIQQAFLKPAAVGSTQTGDQFGVSVAVGGDTVIVGAILEDSSTTGVNSTPNESSSGSGAAYAYAGFGSTLMRASFDFDGDAKSDFSVFRPNGTFGTEWWWLKSGGGNGAVQFGAATDNISAADFTGDGKTDVAFWRPATGQWFVLRSEDFSFFAFPFGATGDVPVPADYDGDGKADAAVFRQTTLTWYISKSTGGTDIVGFGASGDKPVVSDYDGDGKADIAVFRPNGANGAEWWIRRSSNSTVFATQFGSPTDKAVPADYTGDGKADIAFWTPSSGNWFVLRSEDYSYFGFPFGSSTDIPSSGDYDGDGKTDAAVFRPSNSTWYVQRSTAGILIQQFGAPGDVPVPSAYVR